MKVKRFAVLGAIVAFLLSMCVITVLLVNVAGLMFLKQEKPRPVKIALIAPLATPTIVMPVVQPPAAVKAPGLIAAAIEEPIATATLAPVVVPGPTITPTPLVPAGLATLLQPTVTPTPAARLGQATRLVIPLLNLDAPVLLAPVVNETWQVNHLEQAVGHLEGTAPPGSNSNLVLAGHVTLAQGVYGPFAGLAKLPPGALLLVYAGEDIFYYVVDSLHKVDSGAVQVTYPSTTGQITLITCTTWSGEQKRYVERLVVRGHLLKL
jgi:LPXTG-site transpeptidase (sortase) family protein